MNMSGKNAVRRGWGRDRTARAVRIGSMVLALTSVVSSAGAGTALAEASFDHEEWGQLLQDHVDADGRVAYRRLASARPRLDGYLSRLAQARPEDLGRKEQLAFWINAYNAMAVAGILDGYHAESTFGRYRFFKSYEREVAGRKRTLDQIEHDVIRPTFNDFRAHFAVNCASTSCPVLRNEAYSAGELDAQLDDQARRFLQDPSRNRFAAASGAVELSRIFEWFTQDFTAGGKTLADTLAPYLNEEQRQLMAKLPVRFLEYDWTMNAQSGQRP
jgi:hypothetical protein